MRTCARGHFAGFAVGTALTLAVTACSSGSAKVLVQSTPPAPLASTATTATATGTPSPTPTAAPTKKKHRPAVAVTTAAPAAAPTTAAPRSTPTAQPKPSPTKTVTRTSTCTTKGPTTTIQMVAPERFSPSAVTINRCDAVKAIYADSAGATHNWTGPGWASPDMSSAGQSYTYRFTSSGRFNFFCSYHQSFGMTGTITVR